MAVDLIDATNKDIELPGQPGTQLLNCGDLLLFANYTGDGPRAIEEQWGEKLSNFTVPAEEKDVVGVGHDELRLLGF